MALAGNVGREVAKGKALIVTGISDELNVGAICDLATKTVSKRALAADRQHRRLTDSAK